jgi:hypothetical protein
VIELEREYIRVSREQVFRSGLILAIWNAAIYCTLVVLDRLVVCGAETLAYKRWQKAPTERNKRATEARSSGSSSITETLEFSSGIASPRRA